MKPSIISSSLIRAHIKDVKMVCKETASGELTVDTDVLWD